MRQSKLKFLKKCKTLNFRDYIFESLNSSFDVVKTEVIDNVTFYYIDMTVNYRIFIEEIRENSLIHLHVGFERYIDDNWNVDDVTNDLTGRELLGLFGTVKSIVKMRKFNSLLFVSENHKKIQVYHNIARKLSGELNFSSVSRNDNMVIITDGSYTPRIYDKMKYKKHNV